MSKLGDWVRNRMRNWLQIVPAPEQMVTLQEQMNRQTEILRSQIWYRGDSSELIQFFHQINTGFNTGAFWASVPNDRKIRKIHSGLPAMIADTLAYMVSADIDSIDGGCEDWDDVEKCLDLRRVIRQAVLTVLIAGDGAFRVSFDSDASDLPIVEFISGEHVEFNTVHGVCKEVIFTSMYKSGEKRFELRERYGRGYVESRLFDDSGKEYPLDTIDELKGIEPLFTFDSDIMLAMPLKFFESMKYEGRGRSIFDGGRSDCFDALDEIISQWLDALRAGRVQKYIPTPLIPRNPDDGSLTRLNSFGTEFVEIGAALGDGDGGNKIDVIQPDIDYEAFVNSYTSTLTMCLQGLVSPATLGIDVGKMASADAQREKKDVTGNTRNAITTELEKVMPELIRAVLSLRDILNGEKPKEYEAQVTFGEYGAPDFDSRVETVGKAAAYGIMSTESVVDELWGSSKDDAEKALEVVRIKAEKGIASEGEPHFTEV